MAEGGRGRADGCGDVVLEGVTFDEITALAEYGLFQDDVSFINDNLTDSRLDFCP